MRSNLVVSELDPTRGLSQNGNVHLRQTCSRIAPPKREFFKLHHQHLKTIQSARLTLIMLLSANEWPAVLLRVQSRKEGAFQATALLKKKIL